MTDPVSEPTDHPTSANELAIVQIVLGQLTLMEARLSSRIDRLDAASSSRWKAHDAEHDALLKAIQAIGHRLDDHLKKEAQDELIFDARVAPMRRATAWLIREWRTVAIVVLLLADFLGRFAGEVGAFFGQ